MASLKGNVEIKFRSLERENTKGIVRCSNPKNEIAREERCSDDQKVTIGLDISSAELNIFCGFRQLSRPSQTNEATNAPLNGSETVLVHRFGDPKTPLFKRKAPKTGSRCSKSQRGLPTKSFKNPRISRICTEYKNNLESNLHRRPEQRLVNIRPNVAQKDKGVYLQNPSKIQELGFAQNTKII